MRPQLRQKAGETSTEQGVQAEHSPAGRQRQRHERQQQKRRRAIEMRNAEQRCGAQMPQKQKQRRRPSQQTQHQQKPEHDLRRTRSHTIKLRVRKHMRADFPEHRQPMRVVLHSLKFLHKQRLHQPARRDLLESLREHELPGSDANRHKNCERNTFFQHARRKVTQKFGDFDAVS